MSVSVAAAEQTLHAGMSSILANIEDLHGGPVGSRVQRARDVWNQLTWCEARSNEVQALHDGTLTDTCLILVPDHEARYLPTQATMQTQKARVGSVRVFVRTAAFRAEWAALGLLHELSHVIDYHDSVDIDSTPGGRARQRGTRLPSRDGGVRPDGRRQASERLVRHALNTDLDRRSA